MATLAVIVASIHDARSASFADAYLKYVEYQGPEHPNTIIEASASASGPTSASIDASALGLSGPVQPIAQVSASTAGLIRFEAQGDPDSPYPYQGPFGKQATIQGRFQDTLIFHMPQVVGEHLPPVEVTFNFRAEGFIHGDPAAATLAYGGAHVFGRFHTFGLNSIGHYEVVGSLGRQANVLDYGLTTDWGSTPDYQTPYHAHPITGFVDTGVRSVTYRLWPPWFDWGTPATTFQIVWSASAQGFVYGDGALDFMGTIGGEIVLPASLPAGVTFTTESGVTPNVRYVGENHAPAATAQSLSTLENTSLAVTLTGSDADNDPLTFSAVSGPTHGTLTGTPPNLTYTPAANYYGPDSFTFKVNDGTADSAPATVSLIVRPAADLNDDGCVDQTDLTILQAQVRARSTAPQYDLNRDGKIDVADTRWLTLRFTNPRGTPCNP